MPVTHVVIEDGEQSLDAVLDSYAAAGDDVWSAAFSDCEDTPSPLNTDCGLNVQCGVVRSNECLQICS